MSDDDTIALGKRAAQALREAKTADATAWIRESGGSAWRKQPPTVDEVRACQWWWNRSPGVVPHVLRLDVDDGAIWYANDDPAQFEPKDWGGDRAEWAPCLPPA